jgi:hypothetical protein
LESDTRSKAAYENSITPFWIALEWSEFFECVSRATEAKLPHLLELPSLDKVHGNLTARFIATRVFQDFISRTVRIFEAKPEQASSPAYIALMALIQMITKATRLLQTTAPTEPLVATGVFESLTRVRPSGIRFFH